MPYKDKDEKRKVGTNLKRIERNKSKNQNESMFSEDAIKKNMNMRYVLASVILQMMKVGDSNTETIVRARAISNLANTARAVLMDLKLLEEAEELAKLKQEEEDNEQQN